jgi:formamidopyrimidine-DNA glycosylase
MPELPEVEHVRATLLPLLRGVRIARATLARTDIIERIDEAGNVLRSKRARAAPALQSPTPDELLDGCTIRTIERVGKQLCINAGEDEPVLGVHLGMSGQLFVVPHGAASPVRPFASGIEHVHARWQLEHADGSPAGELRFRDPRRFGALSLMPSPRAMRAWLHAHLGPDALQVSGEHLHERLKSSTRCIKAALLDQRVVAGVGNIYADEALFLAGLHPLARCDRLSAAAMDVLTTQLRALLVRAVGAGGSTVRDYVDATGRPGEAQLLHAVYGRGTQPCLRCGTPLKQATIAQRTSVWCPRCQTRRA